MIKSQIESIYDLIEEELLNPIDKTFEPQESTLCGRVPLDEEEGSRTDEE
jgi:hypothetical protein